MMRRSRSAPRPDCATAGPARSGLGERAGVRGWHSRSRGVPGCGSALAVGQASPEHWPPAGPLTVLGWLLSVGGGVLPEQASGPLTWLASTPAPGPPLLPVRLAGPPMVSPPSCTPAVLRDKVTGPLMVSGPQPGAPSSPASPISTNPVLPVTDTRPAILLAQMLSVLAPAEVSGPPRVDWLIATVASAGIVTGPLMLAPAIQVTPLPTVSGPGWLPVMVVVHPPATIDSAWLAAMGGVSESVTPTVSSLVPRTAGVPEMTPVAASRLSPVGSLPEVTDQV